MIELPLDYFPFDGNCKGSKHTDLTLRFDDDSTLRAHSTTLKIVSPVLETALDKCRHEGEIFLRDDDKFAWILLLNVLRPFARLFYQKPMTLYVLDQMVVDLTLWRDRFVLAESCLGPYEEVRD